MEGESILLIKLNGVEHHLSNLLNEKLYLLTLVFIDGIIKLYKFKARNNFTDEFEGGWE